MARKQLQELRTTLSLDSDAFNRSAKQSQSDLKALRSEMNFVRASGNEYANSLDGLRKQSDILNRELKVQRDRLESIRKKHQEAVKAGNEHSEEARRLQAQYNNVASQIQRTERRLEGINSAIDDQTNKWKTLGRNVSQAGENIQQAGQKMSDFGSTMSASVTAPIVAGGALAVETTREFREDLARLETNAREAGLGINVTEDAMRRLNGITSETDSNVEALSNLMATGMNENQLMQAVDDLSGAVIKFPDTLKIEGLADGLQETLATKNAIGPFAELLERMGVDLEVFNEGLEGAAKNGEEVDYVLGQLNNLNLSRVTNEYRKANKELVEGREAQYDFMLALSELGETLEPIATRITEKITDVVEWFNKLPPATQDSIVKFMGLAAAVGPVSLGLGKLTGGLGGLVKWIGDASSKLGDKGGKGLIGKFASMSMGGQVGLAVAGVGLLGGAVYGLYKEMNKLHDISTEYADNLNKQHEANEETITKLDELRRQSSLTNDEFARYLDLNTRLQEETDPEAIAEIEEEMKELKKESGLSNEQLQTMIGLNNDLVENLPGATKEITEQGNRIADTTENLQDYNDELAKMALRDLEKELNESIANSAELTKDLKKAQDEYNDSKEYEGYISRTVQDMAKNGYDQTVDHLEKELERLETEQQRLDISEEQLELINKQRDRTEWILNAMSQGEDGLHALLATRMEETDELQTQVETIEEQLSKTGEIVGKMTEQQLILAGISEAKAEQAVQDGNIVGLLDEQKEALNDQLTQLEMKNTQGTIEKELYREQKEELQEQLEKLEEAELNILSLIDVAGEYNEELSKDITKDINARMNPDYDDINAMLAQKVQKRVELSISNPSGVLSIPRFADGTEFHQGGPALVGEEGYEIAKLGNQLSLLNMGIYDLPRGTEVFTHYESKKILNALNSFPKYAEGARPVGEANRVIEGLNTPQQSQITIQQMIVRNDNDIEQIAYELHRLEKNAIRGGGYV